MLQASYVIPILNDLLNNSENLLDGENNYCNPYALILSPTEELGREIHETVNLYAKNTGIKIKDIYSHDGDNFLSNNPNTLTVTRYWYVIKKKIYTQTIIILFSHS